MFVIKELYNYLRETRHEEAELGRLIDQDLKNKSATIIQKSYKQKQKIDKDFLDIGDYLCKEILKSNKNIYRENIKTKLHALKSPKVITNLHIYYCKFGSS